MKYILIFKKQEKLYSRGLAPLEQIHMQKYRGYIERLKLKIQRIFWKDDKERVAKKELHWGSQVQNMIHIKQKAKWVNKKRQQ